MRAFSYDESVRGFLLFLKINMTETALVIINMQNVRIEKNSEYYLGNLDTMVEKMNYLIAYARELGYKIIFIKHHEAEGAFAIDNPLSDFIPELAVEKHDIVIPKYKISSFYNTKLEPELAGIKNLVVCWALTNLCVRMFVEEAYDREYRIALIDDLTVTYSDELHDATLQDLSDTRSDLNILPLEKFVE